MIKYKVPTLIVTELGHSLLEREPKSRRSWLPANRADAEHLHQLLGTRRDRPRNCSHACELSNELPPPHTIPLVDAGASNRSVFLHTRLGNGASRHPRPSNRGCACSVLSIG